MKSWRISSPVQGVDLELCATHSIPLSFLLPKGRVFVGGGTAVGAEVLEHIPWVS